MNVGVGRCCCGALDAFALSWRVRLLCVFVCVFVGVCVSEQQRRSAVTAGRLLLACRMQRGVCVLDEQLAPMCMGASRVWCRGACGAVSVVRMCTPRTQHRTKFAPGEAPRTCGTVHTTHMASQQVAQFEARRARVEPCTPRTLHRTEFALGEASAQPQ